MIESADDLYGAIDSHLRKNDNCPVCGSEMDREVYTLSHVEKTCTDCVLVLTVTADWIGIYSNGGPGAFLERKYASEEWYMFVTRLQNVRNHD